MQFVDGKSLDVVLRERGSSTLPLPVAGLILSQVAAGLEHAHARGVVHRDVKPANVLLDPAGQVFVSDFGIARRYGAATATASGVLLGTASYMSPEQCLGRRAEAASDQYAFGVMAFELLAGRRPFTGRTSELLSAHINDPPPRLSEFRPDLSPEIESFVMRTLEKDPAARHPNLREAERFFRRLVPDESTATTQLRHVSLRKPMEASRPADAVVESATTVAKYRGSSGTQRTSVMGHCWLRALAWRPCWWPALSYSARPRGLARRPCRRFLKSRSLLEARPNSRRQCRRSRRRKRRIVFRIVLPLRRMTGSSTAASNGSIADDHDRAGHQARPPIAPRALTPRVRGCVRRVSVQPKVVVTPPPPPPSVTATVADARAVASEFLTWCNHRQWRDVERLPSLEGSADLRNELIRLIRSAPDFQAGFERLASRPVLSDRTFTTDFVLDLEWRGGQRQLQVTVSAELSNGSWHLAGFGVHPPD